MSTSNVTVESDVKRGFIELWKNPIKVPDFQRAYAWTEKNLRKLLEDFRTFLQTKERDNLANVYYMGAILLFRSKSGGDNHVDEVIDGQQRLTTLSILYYILNGTLPENCQFEFSNPTSIKLIKAAKSFFKREISDGEKKILKELFDILEFTVITTENQDDAFIFFDTQNNRGVPLKATELLKAHHLREISGISGQAEAAKRWESLELLKMKYGSKRSEDSLTSTNVIDELFEHYLYHARRWTGREVQYINQFQRHEKRDALMNEFATNTIKSNSSAVRLYPHIFNQHVHSVEIDVSSASKNSGGYLPEYRYREFKHTPLSIPFSLRQPIDKGMGYFLFVEKYALLLEYLTNVEDNYLKDFDVFNQALTLHPDMSRYARRFYMLCVLCYYDKFGSDGLMKFVHYLEFLIGAIRMKERLLENSVSNVFLRDSSTNLLDIILNAYTPEQVHGFMFPLLENHSASYNEKKVGGDVVGRYVRRVLKFYSKDESEPLTNKLSWLKEKVKSL